VGAAVPWAGGASPCDWGGGVGEAAGAGEAAAWTEGAAASAVAGAGDGEAASAPRDVVTTMTPGGGGS